MDASSNWRANSLEVCFCLRRRFASCSTGAKISEARQRRFLVFFHVDAACVLRSQTVLLSTLGLTGCYSSVVIHRFRLLVSCKSVQLCIVCLNFTTVSVLWSIPASSHPSRQTIFERGPSALCNRTFSEQCHSLFVSGFSGYPWRVRAGAQGVFFKNVPIDFCRSS